MCCAEGLQLAVLCIVLLDVVEAVCQRAGELLHCVLVVLFGYCKVH